MLSCIEHDKSALVRIDWSTGEERVLFKSERADVTDAIFNARSFEPEAVCIDAARQEWTALTPEVVPELVEALRDPHIQVRSNAAHALARLDPVP